MGVISKDWWFDGNSFWSQEYWFEDITVIEEPEWDTIVNFTDDTKTVICKLHEDELLTWEKQVINVSDLVDAYLAKVWWTLN
jgi:hypothetical protein